MCVAVCISRNPKLTDTQNVDSLLSDLRTVRGGPAAAAGGRVPARILRHRLGLLRGARLAAAQAALRRAVPPRRHKGRSRGPLLQFWYRHFADIFVTNCVHIVDIDKILTTSLRFRVKTPTF